MRERDRRAASSVRGRAARAAPEPSDDGGLDSGLRELRSSIANLRAAAEALEALRGKRRGQDGALLGAIVEEARRASEAVAALSRRENVEAASRPGSPAVATSRFVAEIRRRAASDLQLAIAGPDAPDARIAAPPELIASLLGVLALLRRDFGVGEATVSTRLHDSLLSLDFAFAAREPEASHLADRHAALLSGELGGEPGLAQAARAAGGEAWIAIRRGEPTFSLRILISRVETR